MELGNMLFGNSRGEYAFPDRNLVECDEWQKLLEITDSDGYGRTYLDQLKSSSGGIDTEYFAINPYYWGECDCDDENDHDEKCPCIRHNFIYKPTGFAIDWYKYPFRDSYMNMNLFEEQIKWIFKKCFIEMTYIIDNYADDDHIYVFKNSRETLGASRKYMLMHEARASITKSYGCLYPNETLEIQRVKLREAMED